nr:hypothetical protein [Pyrinomonadaceae bacterium]
MKLLFTIAVSLLMTVTLFSQETTNLIYSPAASFVVTGNGDSNDLTTFDNLCLDAAGGCTLRAAIQQANALAGNDTITFALNTPTTINLRLGELSVLQSVTITGPGAKNLTIQRDPSIALGRIFNIQGPFGDGTTVNISGVTIANGKMGTDFGGGIRNAPGNTLNLSGVIDRDNSAEVGAGFLNYGTLNIVNSTINNNIANSEGGGIHNQSIGTVNIANTTISDNRATNFGGGIATFNQMTLNNVTISNNTAGVRGGGIYNENVNVSLRNTIAANNSASSGPNVYGTTYSSRGYNLIGNSAGSLGFTNGVNGDKVGSSTAPVNPLLGQLLSNGGQTDTRELLSGSPAIDAGDDCVTSGCVSGSPSTLLTTDQRGSGFSRRTDGNGNGTATVDMGAFEFPAAPVSCSYTLGSNSQSFSNSGGNGSFTINTNSTCSWSAQSNNSWVAVTSGNGTGSGTVQFTVQSNPGAARTGGITIAGQTFTVNQDAAAATLTYEGDITSRPNGDGSILSNDVVQMRKFLNGTDTINLTTDEFRRADSAPFASRGDGKILSDDVVQARRYQNGTNPKQTVGGPMTQSFARTDDEFDNQGAKLSKTTSENAVLGNPREVRVESASGSAGQMVTVNIRVNAVGNESEYGFIITYDTSVLSNPVIGAGNAGASVRSCNSTTTPGQINCSVGGFPNDPNQNGIGEIAAGNNQILITVTFTVAPNAPVGVTSLTLSNVNASSDAPELFRP